MGGGNKDMKFIGYTSRPTRDPLPGNAWVSGNDRRGPWIEQCLFEGLSDDGPNITGNLYFIKSQHSPKSFQLDTEPGYQDALWKPGDELPFWNPTTGQLLMETKIDVVLAEKPGSGQKTITTADAPTGLNIGTDMRQHTHVYNISCQNTGFVARNNRFVDGRRFENNEFANRVNSGFAKNTNIGIWVRSVTRGVVLKNNRMTDQREF